MIDSYVSEKILSKNLEPTIRVELIFTAYKTVVITIILGGHLVGADGIEPSRWSFTDSASILTIHPNTEWYGCFQTKIEVFKIAVTTLCRVLRNRTFSFLMHKG